MSFSISIFREKRTSGTQNGAQGAPNHAKMTPKWSQNGAKTAPEDPYETCTGMGGSYIRPSLSGQFLTLKIEHRKMMTKSGHKTTFWLKLSQFMRKVIQNDPRRTPKPIQNTLNS